MNDTAVKRVLIVGMNMTDYYRQRMLNLKWNVTVVSSAEESFNMLQFDKFDLLIVVGFVVKDMATINFLKLYNENYKDRIATMYLYEGVFSEGHKILWGKYGADVCIPRICPEKEFYETIELLLNKGKS